jgi:two-component system cell cycle response regulator DivK
MAKINKLILIVDDEPQNRKLFRDVLKHKGYTTIEAENGRQGVEMAEKFMPDLILMDMHLPIMDGIEATKHLLSNESTSRIPIVALTASVMPGDRERILEAGCQGYISKPVHISDLLSSVAEYLSLDYSKPSSGDDHG